MAIHRLLPVSISAEGVIILDGPLISCPSVLGTNKQRSTNILIQVVVIPVHIEMDSASILISPVLNLDTNQHSSIESVGNTVRADS